MIVNWKSLSKSAHAFPTKEEKDQWVPSQNKPLQKIRACDDHS